MLLLLGLTGTITWTARVIRQSVSAGLQLVLGISAIILGMIAALAVSLVARWCGACRRQR